MNKTAKRWIVRFGIIVTIILLAGFIFKDTLLRQVGIYFMGLQERQADEFGYRLEGIDQIEIMSLGTESGSAGPAPRTAMDYQVYKTSVVQGSELKPLMDYWHTLKRARFYSGMCHDPAYVLRFYNDGKLIFETSVCWHCHNYEWRGPLGTMFEYGFDADSDGAKAFLELLKSHSPLPPQK